LIPRRELRGAVARVAGRRAEHDGRAAAAQAGLRDCGMGAAGLQLIGDIGGVRNEAAAAMAMDLAHHTSRRSGKKKGRLDAALSLPSLKCNTVYCLAQATSLRSCGTSNWRL